MKAQTKRRGLALALLLAVTVAIGWIRSSPQEPPPPDPVVIMSQPFAIPVPKVGLLDRVMPRNASWAWLWRVRYGLLGLPRSISINSTIIDLTSATPSALTDLLRGEPEIEGGD